jgi:hypothetical protein
MRISLIFNPSILDQLEYQAEGQLRLSHESNEVLLDVDVIATRENRLLTVSYRGVEIAQRRNCIDQDLGRREPLPLAALIAGKLLTALMENRLCPCCGEPYSLTNPIEDTPDDPLMVYALTSLFAEVLRLTRVIDSRADRPWSEGNDSKTVVRH